MGFPYNKDHSILGSILGSPYLGKLPNQGFQCLVSRIYFRTLNDTFLGNLHADHQPTHGVWVCFAKLCQCSGSRILTKYCPSRSYCCQWVGPLASIGIPHPHTWGRLVCKQVREASNLLFQLISEPQVTQLWGHALQSPFQMRKVGRGRLLVCQLESQSPCRERSNAPTPRVYSKRFA